MQTPKESNSPFVQEKRDDQTAKEAEKAIKKEQQKTEPDPADNEEEGNPGIDSKGPEATRPKDNKEEEGPAKE